MSIITGIVWIVISFVAGGVGQLATGPSIPTWYATLNRPAIAPPNWLFGPVWTLLYISMGIAAAIIWQKGIANKVVKVAIIIFLIQLVLNGLWSFIFFGWHWLFIAFIEILVMWFFIVLTIVKFYALSPTAGLIMVPYLLWVTFASILNFSFWWINR
ncbi:MAG: TspO/MBR family protein [Candidatus Margulisiibacteriota bacterium]